MSKWSRDELIVAFTLYCQMPYGKIHSRNKTIVKTASFLNRTPSALAMKMLNIASLDPEIQRSGRSGLGNASKGDQEIWNEFHDNWDAAFDEADRIIGDHLINDAAEPEVDFEEETSYSMQVSRKKQGFFRNSVLASYQNVCCISGVKFDKLLVASHIIPWSKNKKQRLNPSNGLCLSVLHDKVIDLGLITVTPDFVVEASAKLKELADDPFSQKNLHSIHGKKIRLPEKFVPAQEFLEWHNENVYQG